MLFFSATYDDEVMKFARAVVSDAAIIRLKREEESLDNIKQYYIVCKDQEDKFFALSNIYGAITIGQSMIFCQVSGHLLCIIAIMKWLAIFDLLRGYVLDCLDVPWCLFKLRSFISLMSIGLNPSHHRFLGLYDMMII